VTKLHADVHALAVEMLRDVCGCDPLLLPTIADRPFFPMWHWHRFPSAFQEGAGCREGVAGWLSPPLGVTIVNRIGGA